MPLIQLPIPLPMPIPVPGIGVQPSPGITPGVATGVAPAPTTGGTSGSFTGAFADLFNISVNWKYIIAVFLLLATVNIAEGWNVDYAWFYVGILLLGVILVDGRFTPQLRNLLGGN